MRPDPPAWVRDAVFYQIFPDRFAASRAGPEARVRSSRGMRRRPSTASRAATCSASPSGSTSCADLGVTALYLTPIFSVGIEPPLPHVRLPGGRPAARRRRGASRAARPCPRARHAGRPRRRVQPLRSGLLAVPPRRREWRARRRTATGSTSTGRASLDGGAALGRLPGGRSGRDGVPAASASATGLGGTLPALPKLNVENPHVREYLLGVAEHWLRFGIDGWRLDVPEEIEDPTFWPEFRRRVRAVDPEAYLVGEIWDEAPDWLSGDRFDALMNYPLALGDPRVRRRRSARRRASIAEQSTRTGAMLRPLDGPSLGGRLEHLMTHYDPAVTAVQLNLLGSHDTPRALTVIGGDPARSGWRRFSS